MASGYRDLAGLVFGLSLAALARPGLVARASCAPAGGDLKFSLTTINREPKSAGQYVGSLGLLSATVDLDGGQARVSYRGQEPKTLKDMLCLALVKSP